MKKLMTVLVVMLMSMAAMSQIKVYNMINDDPLYDQVLNAGAKELGIQGITVLLSKGQFDPDLFAYNEQYAASVHTIPSCVFSINIVSYFYSDRDITILLLHELVHIKQVLDGRLIIGRYMTIFDNKAYTASNSTVRNRPFEIEAERISYQLYSKLKKLR